MEENIKPAETFSDPEANSIFTIFVSPSFFV